MKREYVFVFIAGLFILAYVLDALVNPLNTRLVTPYHFFTPKLMFNFAFTTASVIIKSIALLMSVFWFMSYIRINKLLKGGVLLFLSAFMQLYALQDVATNSLVIPLEWSLSLTLTGMVLLIPAAIFILAGLAGKAHQTITKDPYEVKESSDSEDDTF